MPKTLEDPDSLLIQTFVNNREEDAFRQLMEKYQDQVHNYCSRFFGNDWDAADCCQEIFIKVFQNLERFRFKSKFSSWIYRIMINTCNEMYRSKSYRSGKSKVEIDISKISSGESHKSHLSYDTNPELIFYRKQVNEAFQNALDSLKPSYRSLIILRDIEGHSYDEIAKITGLKIGTVRSSLARARYKMAGQLKEFRHAM